MAHEVKFSIPERPLGRADIEIKVQDTRGQLGKLRISRGSVVWVPANKQYGYKLYWRLFDKLAQEHGKPGSR